MIQIGMVGVQSLMTDLTTADHEGYARDQKEMKEYNTYMGTRFNHYIMDNHKNSRAYRRW